MIDRVLRTTRSFQSSEKVAREWSTARDRVLQRDVALKFLGETLAQSPLPT
jgi:hypothetical protein